VGALYVRRHPRVRLRPLFHGGGQERGLRSGTLPTPLCVGLGEAAAIAQREMAADGERLAALAARMLAGLRRRLPDCWLNGDPDRRIPGNLNIGVPGIDADSLLAATPELSLSSGAACASASLEPSYVLRALGLGEDAARASLRIGVGRFTTEDEADYAVDCLAAAVERHRAVAPRAIAR
jgi:cysteine desulfurase